MADKKQKTPKGDEIPVWKRKDAMRNLKKVARANERVSRPVHRPQKH